jgi:hypothetical protein
VEWCPIDNKDGRSEILFNTIDSFEAPSQNLCPILSKRMIKICLPGIYVRGMKVYRKTKLMVGDIVYIGALIC